MLDTSAAWNDVTRSNVIEQAKRDHAAEGEKAMKQRALDNLTAYAKDCHKKSKITLDILDEKPRENCEVCNYAFTPDDPAIKTPYFHFQVHKKCWE